MNQNPEQFARDEIDKQLKACRWVIQDKRKLISILAMVFPCVSARPMLAKTIAI